MTYYPLLRKLDELIEEYIELYNEYMNIETMELFSKCMTKHNEITEFFIECLSKAKDEGVKEASNHENN